MIETNYFLKAEDDTDFIPIIPLNETENENDKITSVPDSLPVLPLRNTVLFPGVVLPVINKKTGNKIFSAAFMIT